MTRERWASRGWLTLFLSATTRPPSISLIVRSRPIHIFPSAWDRRGWVYLVGGRFEEAIRSLERGIRLSPLDPFVHTNLAGIGYALIELRRFDEAVAVSKKALRQNSSDPTAFRGLASALAHLGRDAEAHDAAARVLEIDPAYTISGRMSLRAQTTLKLLVEGLRKAGLPE